MDLSKFKPSDWLMVGGAVVTLICGLALDWAKVSGGGLTVSGNNAFDYFFTGGLAWLLTVAVGVLAILLVTGQLRSSNAPWPLIMLGAAGLALLLMVIRLIMGGGDERGVDLDRNTGMYVTFVGVAVTAVGAFIGFTAAGGDLRDLTNPNKFKQAFDRPGAQTPPPPAPPTPPAGGGIAPPPPPPGGGSTPPPPPPTG
ncbi:MAG: hypothetical protein ACK5OX_00095 [Desertimonas sp.]